MKYISATFLALLLVLAVAAGCQGEGSEQAATQERTGERETGPATVVAEEDRAGTGGATADKSATRAEGKPAGKGKAGTKRGKAESAGKGSGGNGRADTARLKVSGKAGTKFSGTCAVGGREEDVSGRVPARYEYELNGRRIECELRTKDGGALKVTFTSGGDRVRQKIQGRAATFRFVYSADGTSSVSATSEASFSKREVKSFGSSSSVETR